MQGYSLTESAKIDETVEPYIVDANGNKATLDAEGYYVVPGQGKYKVTANGKDVDVEFIPEDNFLGTADGISIRRTDSNGYDTGWSTKFPNQEANVDTVLNTMDGLYIPTVTQVILKGLIRLQQMSKVRLKLVPQPLTQLQLMLMATRSLSLQAWNTLLNWWTQRLVK